MPEAVRVPLAAFAPDIASVDASVASVATNVLPRADGYGPILAPVPVTLALPGDCRGAISVESPAYDYTTYFAGTATKLYRYNLGTRGWIDATPSGVTVGVVDNAYWSWALYGDRLVATGTSGPPLVIQLDRGKRFERLGGSPPRARLTGIVGGYLVLANLAGDTAALQWSDVENIETWTPGAAGQAGDRQVLPDGGPITGFAGGEFGLVFQRRAIRRMVLSGSGFVFDFSVAEQNRGCVSPSALVSVGGRVYFLDRDGFYVFDGASSSIGAERVNRFFFDRVDPTALLATVASRDVTGPRVFFSYRTKLADPAQPGLLDETLIYDWSLDRWSVMAVPVRYVMQAATPATSIDALTGSVDAMTKTFDSPDYAGGVPGTGVFGADNRLALLTGPALEATTETAEAQLARPNRAFVRGIRFDTDGDDWRVAVAVRESLKAADPPTWKPETAPTVERFAPCRASGRYHRMRMRIPAGTSWRYASAIEADATAEGRR